MINQTVSINNFSGLLKDEELPAGDLQTVLLVLSEISQKQDHFQANTSELVQLAAQHSPTFQHYQQNVSRSSAPCSVCRSSFTPFR